MNIFIELSRRIPSCLKTENRLLRFLNVAPVVLLIEIMIVMKNKSLIS